MRGVVVVCADCHQPVEALMVAHEITRFVATQPFADSHLERFKHYPERVHVFGVDAWAVNRVGRRVSWQAGAL